MKHVIWKYLTGFAILGLAGVIAVPFFTGSSECCRPPSCQSNLKQIGLAFAQYTQDFDSHYPPVRLNNSTFGWAGVLQMYLKRTEILQCQQETSVIQTDPRQRYYTDYWMNARLSAVGEKNLASTALTILNGEGNTGTDVTDARYSFRQLPYSWIIHKSSPIHRHLDGSNYSFTDGHVKWYRPEEIAPTMVVPVSKGVPTFAFD